MKLILDLFKLFFYLVEPDLKFVYVCVCELSALCNKLPCNFYISYKEDSTKDDSLFFRHYITIICKHHDKFHVSTSHELKNTFFLYSYLLNNLKAIA